MVIRVQYIPTRHGGAEGTQMQSYTAHLMGPKGSSQRLDILAADMQHARQLAREHGALAYGRRGFSFTVRVVA